MSVDFGPGGEGFILTLGVSLFLALGIGEAWKWWRNR